MRMLKYKLKLHNDENRICFLSSISLTSYAITLLFAGAIGYENVKGWAFLAFNSIFILLFLTLINKIYRESKLFIYAIFWLVMLNYLITLMNNLEYIDYYIKIGVQSFAFAIPWMFVNFAVNDYIKLKQYLLYVAYAILGIFLANYFFAGGEFAQSSFAYSQGHSYALLAPTVIFLDKLFEKITIPNTILFLASLIMMISMGARGPLLCLSLYCFLKLILHSKTSHRGSLYIMLYVLITALLFPLYEEILNFFRDIFIETGLSIRLIDFILEQRVFEDNARIMIREASVATILDNLFIGVGVGADRLAIARYFNDLESAIGLYPHNFFLEIFMQYGLIIGGLIISAVLIVVFHSLFFSQNKTLQDIICIYFTVGFLPLLVSGSYFAFPLFWAFLGLCLKGYTSKHKNKEPLLKEVKYVTNVKLLEDDATVDK